jgi:hypothetical protein
MIVAEWLPSRADSLVTTFLLACDQLTEREFTGLSAKNTTRLLPTKR